MKTKIKNIKKPKPFSMPVESVLKIAGFQCTGKENGIPVFELKK